MKPILFPRGDCFSKAVIAYGKISSTVALLSTAYHALADAGVDLEIIDPVLRSLRIELAKVHTIACRQVPLDGGHKSDIRAYKRACKLQQEASSILGPDLASKMGQAFARMDQRSRREVA